MSLEPANILWVIGLGSSVATFLFWGAFRLGEIKSDIRDAHKRLDDHDEVLGEMQHRRRTDRPYEAR